MNKTYAEIEKALECCNQENGCYECPYEFACYDDKYKSILSKDALDYINRLKAEVERLQKHSKEVAENCTQLLRFNDKETNKRFLEAIENVKVEIVITKV